MPARAHRLVPLAVVVLMVAGCSDDGADADAVLSASTPAPTVGSSITTSAAPMASQASPATTHPVVDQAALQEAIAEVEGLEDLEPPQLGCMSSRLADDEGVLAAIARGLTFAALAPDLQERVLLIAVGCAPAAVAATVVDGIEAELDDETRACVVDRMAGDDGFLVALVHVALATGEPDPDTTVIPPAVTDDLEALMAACDVPPTALPE